MLTWKERQERVEARGAEYRAGAMSEDQFSAYLFSMRYRGEDIRHKLNEHAPPAPAPTFEERRLEVSREWIRSYHGR
jgi:hypothetical protein